MEANKRDRKINLGQMQYTSILCFERMLVAFLIFAIFAGIYEHLTCLDSYLDGATTAASTAAPAAATSSTAPAAAISSTAPSSATSAAIPAASSSSSS